MEEYQAVIVGGGPAGAALGYLLQKQGLRTCIIEKGVFPREKLCGGLMTEKTVTLLERIYATREFPWRNVTSEVEIYLGTTRISRASTRSRFYLVERRDFDYDLIQRYRAAGGVVREGARVRTVEHRRRRLTLADGTGISYRVLVGADGANSQIRRLIAPGYNEKNFCVEASATEPDDYGPVRVYFSVIPGAYGWRFPKGGYDAVGMGGEIVRGRDMKAMLEEFSRKVGAPVEPARIRGAMIPNGRYLRRPWREGLLLVGDAAGFIDPVTGEGIYFALLSATYAAAAVAALFREGRSFAETYAADIRRIHALMDSGNRFRRIFYLPALQPLLLRVRPHSEGNHPVTAWACENILADYRCSYGRFLLMYPVLRLRQKREK